MAKKKAATPRPGPAGMLVPESVFPVGVRRDLEMILRGARPRLDNAAIAAVIAAIQDAQDAVTVMRAGPDPAADTEALDRLGGAARCLQSGLEAARESGLLDSAKAQLGYAPDLEGRLLEALAMLAEAIAKARPRPRRPRGGRPPGGAALAPGTPALAVRWFTAQVVSILRRHGVRVSSYNDGLPADLLRALWPQIMGADLGGDIRRLLQAACAT
jgi:hypothetical protein